MSTYGGSGRSSGRYGVTLEDLREQQHSLNMRLLLSIEIHDGETQSALEQQLHDLQRKIEDLQLGTHSV